MNKTRRRRLGQHFLKDRKVLHRILRHIAPKKGELIIEIGAGRGILTFPLCERAGRVVAVEKDKALIPFLQEKERPNLRVIAADVLKLDFAQIIREEKAEPAKVRLAGNLPYAISSPLLFKVLEERDCLSGCIFLLQKEVAERVCARPGSRKYAPLSILLQVHFQAKLPFVIPARAFSPPPRVESALITLQKRERALIPIEDEPLFIRFLQAAFAHRRKILLNNLEKLLIPKKAILEAYEHFRWPRTIRPEELPIPEFFALFDFFQAAGTMDSLSISK
jgi:16S rRNA (adenine1518-N6/adenine1519-N6)-dimethyltransferase